MSDRLLGKSFIIAGAGGRIGSALTAALLQEKAEVLALDINCSTLNELAKKHNKLQLVNIDLTNEREVTDFFQKDIQINGAVNVSYPRNEAYGKHFFDVTLKSFNENIALHLGSYFLFSQQCAAYFRRNNQSFSLVNFSSVYGVAAPDFSIYVDTDMTMPVEYAAIKSAILHLDKYVAQYVNDSRFRVNSISPGGILAEQPEAFKNAYQKQTHGTGLLGEESCCGTLIYLLSDDSNYVTGQNIIVDDGFTL